MEIIKENWKMVVFIILAIFLLVKLDEISSNGRYVTYDAFNGILDTRNGKVYIADSEKDGLFIWKQKIQEIK